VELSTGVIGLALVLIGVTLLIVEGHVPGWGGPGALGVVAIVAGVLMLLDAGTIIDLPRALVISLCVLAAIFVPVAAFMTVRLRNVPAFMPSTLVGEIGVATSTLDPFGVVHVRSEQHSAEAEAGPIEAGARIRVVEEKGLKLRVVRD
jgi:membrane-bound serine protease (ClpP class)